MSPSLERMAAYVRILLGIGVAAILIGLIMIIAGVAASSDPASAYALGLVGSFITGVGALLVSASLLTHGLSLHARAIVESTNHQTAILVHAMRP